MQNLQLDNKDCLEDLEYIFYQIRMNIIEGQEDIIDELNKLIIQLNPKDQGSVMKYIQNELKTHVFVKEIMQQISKNQFPIDYNGKLDSFFEAQQYEPIIELMKDQHFWQETKLLNKFSEHSCILIKLGQRIIGFITILKNSENKKIISQYQLFLLLLGFLYNQPLNVEDQLILEQMIGSLLNQQIFELQEYLDSYVEDNQFNEFQQKLQSYQMNLSNSLIAAKYQFLFKLFTQDIFQSKNNLDQFFMHAFSLSELNYNNIISNLDEAIRNKKLFNECYFYVVMYYWIQYCLQAQIQSKLTNYLEKSKKPNVQNKMEYFEMFVKQLKLNDEIKIFFLRRVVLFTYSPEQSISLESYKNYKHKQNEQISQLDKCQFTQFPNFLMLSNAQIQKVQQTIQSTSYYQLQRHKPKEELLYLLKIQFWKQQIDVASFQFIQELFKQKGADILSLTLKIEERFQNKKQIIIDLLKMLTLYYNFDRNNFEILHQFLNQYAALSYVDNRVLQLILKCQSVYQCDKQKFIEYCFIIYQKNRDIYEKWMNHFNYFNLHEIKSEIFSQRNCFLEFPNNCNFSLEQFNISLAEQKEEEKLQIINDWVLDSQNPKKFTQLIPFFFNIIKRGDSSQSFTNLIYDCYEKINKQQIQLNMKALFQLFYNNSNIELQVMLLKLYSKYHPVPFIYKNPRLEKIKSEEDLFIFNHNLYYVIPQGYTIINFSLSKQTSQIGKTQLINKIFYQTSQKFEIQDLCEINNKTIDIMFDFSFNQSRSFTIADAHGTIPLSILKKILPFFQFWVVQMDTESELAENYESISQLLQIKNTFKPLICFIVRNSVKEKIQHFDKLVNQIKDLGIYIHFIRDLKNCNQHQGSLQRDLNQVSKFIYNLIQPQYVKQVNFRGSQHFKELMFSFYNEGDHMKLIVEKEKILKQLGEELNSLVAQENGFFCQQAFPIRYIQLRIKEKKNEIAMIYQSASPSKDKISELLTQITDLENQINQQNETKVVTLFRKALQSQNIYILYLQFQEFVQQFNQKHTLETQLEIKYLNELINEQKKLRKTSQQQQITNEQSEELQKQKNKLNSCIKQETIKYIDIQLFWRELIFQQTFSVKNLNIDLVDIVYQFLKKGESFEFLDGDNLKINVIFLKQLAQKFKKQKEGERVLVLSVLGPQSSGKSTILNKIFGCHFLTSIGRCTKGINLQLLKIQNTSLNNLFDHILILDSEGLQSPNKEDPEFDKKMALLILSVSDIILIAINGSMTNQFKDLIEMCIYTLGQMKSSLSFQKQLNWCFNLQNDLTNKAIFLKEFETIQQHLNEGQIEQVEEERIDYSEILDINEKSIQLLGIAQTVKTWEISGDTGVFENWQQIIVEETFSKQAYNYGLQIIKQFSGQKQNKSLTNLEKVVSDIDNNWESLIKLPDLLEFSELKQMQNNDKMKAAFENALKSQDVQFIQNIAPDLQNELNDLQTQSLALFDEIQIRKLKYVKQELSKIEKTIKKQLEETKSKNQISKKITLKYLDQLDQRMLHLDYECRFIILEQIKTYERNLQEKEGFQSIDHYIDTLGPQDLRLYQQNPQLIESKFNDLWMRIAGDAVKQQEQFFSEFQLNEFKAIKQAFPQYSLNSEKESHYLNYFMQHLNTLDPFDQSNQEKEKIFKLFSEDQIQDQFFVFDNQKKYYKFTQLFCQPIKQKLKAYKLQKNKQIISLNSLLEYEVEFTLISKKDLKEYLENIFPDDLLNFVQENQNQVKSIENFIKTLLLVQVSYDQNYFSSLIDALMSQKDNQLNQQTIIELCTQFSKSLKFDVEKQVKIKNDTNHNFYSFYPKIRKQIKIECISQIQNLRELKSKLMQQNIIMKYQIDTKPLEQMQKYKLFIQYIISPQNNVEYQDVFNQEFPSIFNEIMKIYQIWNKIYFSIYEIIQNEMTSKSLINLSNKQQKIEQKNVIFSVSKIQFIMNTIQIEIKEYCNQFSIFGVIFTSIGERYLYYCSIFIIWRFICYQKWQILQIQQNKFAEMKQKQFERFWAEIQQNRHSQSIIKAKILSENILQGIISKFYCEQGKIVKNKILKENLSNFQLVKILDTELLEKRPESQHKEIIEYITDQKEYIKKYVENKIINLQGGLITTFSSQLQEKLKISIASVLDNLSALNSLILSSKCSKDYFKLIKNGNDEYYDSTLYKIVLSYMQGEEDSQINYLREEFKPIFKKTRKRIIIPLNSISSIKSNNQIQILKSFIEELIIQLQQIVKNMKQIQLDLDQFGVQNELDQIKRNMIGCQEMCPLCNRKCDQTIQVDNHRHMCQNGHQIRGMNQVLIENQPSLCTCEEIAEDDIIFIKEIKAMKTWQEIKKMYPEWKFQNVEIDTEKPFIQIQNKVWNSQIGIQLCKKLEIQLNKHIQYQRRFSNQRIYQQSIHLIFVLDCSGSMVKRWPYIRTAVMDSLKEVQDNQHVRVSVIIFNHEAQITIDCEKIDINEQWKKLANRYGDTNFIEAFKALKCQIQKTSMHQFSRILVLFYTDCQHDEVSYPKDELLQLSLLPQKRQTTFIACTNEELSPVLSQIIDYLKQHFYNAELKEAIDGHLIKETFSEKLTKNKLRF